MNPNQPTATSRPDWRRANCRGEPYEVMFPTPENDPDANAKAKAICRACPIMDDCLDHALETREPDGVWGGMTSKERFKLVRKIRDRARQQAAA